jgi:hypothetical protein
METERSWQTYDDIDLSQYHQSSSIQSNSELRHSKNRSSGNTRICKQPRQEEDDTFNNLPLELIGNDYVLNYSAYLRRVMAAQKEMQQQFKNNEEKVKGKTPIVASLCLLIKNSSCRKTINESEESTKTISSLIPERVRVILTQQDD